MRQIFCLPHEWNPFYFRPHKNHQTKCLNISVVISTYCHPIFDYCCPIPTKFTPSNATLFLLSALDPTRIFQRTFKRASTNAKRNREAKRIQRGIDLTSGRDVNSKTR